jgi:hypothetical protein
MSTRMQGMDTEQARQVSGQMDSHASGVVAAVNMTGHVAHAAQFYGPDGERFRNDWEQLFAPNARAAAESLSGQAGVLRAHADRQDAASS